MFKLPLDSFGPLSRDKDGDDKREPLGWVLMAGCLRSGDVKEEPLEGSCLNSPELRTEHCLESGPRRHLSAWLCAVPGPMGLVTFQSRVSPG